MRRPSLLHSDGASRLTALFFDVDAFQDHPESQGNLSVSHNGDLPFMFKVLSISKALSIQVRAPMKATPAVTVLSSLWPAAPYQEDGRYCINSSLAWRQAL